MTLLRQIIFTTLLTTAFTADCLAQAPSGTSPSKDVEILNADYLRIQDTLGVKLTRLVGHVELKQEDVVMYCDSAQLEKDSNSVQAWGNVHIQNDTVNAYGDYLRYDGKKKFAMLQGHTTLSDTRMKLFTEELFYNLKEKYAYYYNWGKVLKDSTVITSKKGYYYTRDHQVFFNEKVRIADPQYLLNSDSLLYHTETKRSTFFGNTEIINKNSKINCNNGWYDSRLDIASFGKNTVVHSPPQVLYADSLYYNRGKGLGKAYYQFTWLDSTMDTKISGHYGEYYETGQMIMATKKPLLTYSMSKDTLYLTADTLRSADKSATDTTKNFFAYRKVRMYMKDMQGLCDSLFYSFEDSTFRMFYSPVVWTQDTQLSGDTIFLRTKNKAADQLSIFNSAFVITPSDSALALYDQIKGKYIFGYFDSNELKKVQVVNNAESLYFGKNDQGKYIGSNHALCKIMWLYFKERKMDKIVFTQQPEAKFTPMKLMEKDEFRLKNFDWRWALKPKDKFDIIPK